MSFPNAARTLRAFFAIALAVAAARSAPAIDTTWNGGTGNWNNAGNWDNGIPNSTAYDVFIDGGQTGVTSTVTLDMQTWINNLSIDAGDTLSIANWYWLGIGGSSINNAGTLQIDATPSGSLTYLYIAGTVTLSGGGTVNMSNSGYNRIQDNSANNGWLVNEDNTIQGSGNIGANTLGFTNRGLILANQSTSLILDPRDGASDFINSGTLRADGGTLYLYGGTYTNFEGGTDGVIDARNGSSVRLRDGAQINGGRLTTSTGGVIETSNWGQLNGVANEGTYRINNGHNTFLNGTIDNTGTIEVSATPSGSNTYLYIPSTVTLSGGGTVNMSNSGYNRIQDNAANNGWLVNEDNTIQGSGNIGANTLGFTNRGLILANQSTSLILDPRDGTSDFINSGTLRADGGTLYLYGGYYTNYEGSTDGVIDARNGSSVRLRDGAQINGGRLTTSTGAVIETSNWGQLNGVANEGTYRINNGHYTFLYGTIDNTGTIEVSADPSGSNTYLYIPGTVTLSGGGTVIMSDSDHNRIQDNSANNGHLINEDNTIQGGGRIGVDTMQLTNRGTIVANQPTALRIDPNGAGVVNRGTLRATGGGMLILEGGTFQNYEDVAGTIYDGTIEAQDTSTARLQSDAHVIGGQLTTSGSGVIDTGGGGVYLRDLTLDGNYRINNAHNTYLEGTITNSAGSEILINSSGGNTYLQIDPSAGVTLSGGGTVTLSNAAQNIIHDPAASNSRLTNEDNTIRGSGNIGDNNMAVTNRSLILANQSTPLILDPRDGAGNFINSGTLRADGGTLYLYGGTYTNYEGGTDGVIDARNGSSVRLRDGAHIIGGRLTTSTGGVIETSDWGQLQDLANEGTYRINNGDNTYLYGTIDNTGTIEVDADGGNTYLYIPGTVTLTGGGTVAMSDSANNRIQDNSANNGHLINEDNTIQGRGNIGADTMRLTNRGLIDATQPGALVIDPNASGALNDTGGIFRGSGAGGLQLTGGAFNNLGTVEALNGSNVTYTTSATTVNNDAGELKLGRWRSVATGSGATVTIRGSNVHTVGVDTEVELSGAGSVFQVASTHLETTLTTNKGTLRILDGRHFSMTNALMNNGTVELGGAGLAGGQLTSGGDITNTAAAEIFGHGQINNTILNSGTVRAANGTLAMVGGVIDGQSGTIQIDPGASLDLSGAGGDSDTDFLFHNGTDLNLGANNVSVREDYSNANFGVGNAFNHRANVTPPVGPGMILAEQPFTLQFEDASTDTPVASIEINTRVGSPVTQDLQVRHNGTPGNSPDVRGAIQTNVNGGNITDARLTVADQNLGPVAPGDASSSFQVAFDGSSAGPLTGQVLHFEDNFDNVDGADLPINGAVYNPAVGNVTPDPVALGEFHVGGPAQRNMTISNAAPAGDYSEDLDVTGIAAGGDASLTAGSPSNIQNVLAGSGNNDVTVQVDTATPGAKSGNLTMDFTTTGEVNNTPVSGLSPESAGSADVSVTASVFRLAADGTVPYVDFGNVRRGSSQSQGLSIQNTAQPSGGFTEFLDAAINSTTGAATASGSVNNLGPGGVDSSSIQAGIDTGTAGAQSGTVVLGFTSDPNGINSLGTTPLGQQTVNVSADVYRPAVAAPLSPDPVDFNIVHVGDGGGTLAQTLSAGNSATNDNFSENLDGAFQSATGAGVSGSGSFAALAPGNNSNALSVSVDTSTAGSISGSATFAFESNGQAFGLGPNLDLGTQTVTVEVQVNNYADPIFELLPGVATLTQDDATHWTLDLGTTMQNSGDLSATLGVKNAAPPAFSDTLSGAFDLGSPPSAFTLSGFDPFGPLAGGQPTPGGLGITLSDDNAGAFSHIISMTGLTSDNGSGSTSLEDIQLLLTGRVTSPGAPVLATTPPSGSTLDFGPVLVGTTNNNGAGQTITAENVGAAGSTLTGQFPGASGEFDPPTPQAFSLAQGATASQEYNYTPTARGADSQSITVTSDGGNSTLTLAGQGVAPQVVVDTAAADAGPVRIGTSGTARVGVNNVGDGNQSGLGSVSNLRGNAAALSNDFTGAGGPIDLADSASAQFDYTYTPTSHAVQTEIVALSLANGSSDGTNNSENIEVAISGQGVGPIFDSNRGTGGTFDFGTVTVGSIGSLPLDLSNVTLDGDLDALTDLTIRSIAITGADAGFFTLTGGFTPDTIIGAQNTLNLGLDFAPDAARTFNAVLNVATDEDKALGEDGNSFTFNLAGMGTAVQLNPVLETTPPDGSTLDFGPVRVGTTNNGDPGQTITAENVGDPGSTLTGQFPGAAAPFDPATTQPFSLAQGTSAVREYNYSPTARGSDSQAVTVTSNGGDSTLALAGQGVGPVFDSNHGAGGEIDFGTLPPDSFFDVTVILENATTDGGPTIDVEMVALSLRSVEPVTLPFSLVGGPSTDVLDPGEIATAVLRFDTTGLGNGTYTDVFRVETDQNAPFGEFLNGEVFLFNLIGRVGVVGIIPEPSALLVWSLLVALGAGSWWRRRRNA